MAKKMNFQINQVAAGLRKHKTFCIGVIVPSISNYFFSATLSGIQDAAAKRQYQVLVCQTNESVIEEERYIKSLSAGRVDGILLSLSKDSQKDKHLHELSAQKMPMVLFDRTMDILDVFKVEAEDYQGSVKVTTHMIEKGCRKIAFLAGPDSMINNSKNRLAGYRDALNSHGMSFHTDLIRVCDFSKEKAKEAVKELMSEHKDIDGIYAVNDDLAIEAILTLKSMGICVPDQVSVSGFGNYPVAEIVEPPLTTIGHNPYVIGYRAAERVMAEIHQEISLDHDQKLELVKSELIERASTAR